MPNYTRNMRRVITYWPPAGNDGFGGSGFGSPEERKCRWQDMAVQFRDPNGEELTSGAVVYVNSPVEVGGYLFDGVSVETDPASVAGALEIRQTGRSASLRQTTDLNKVWL
jgi:hypothetical protein